MFGTGEMPERPADKAIRRANLRRIAGLFRARWHVELDLRTIKITLHMDDLRCKTPEMARREILVHWLAYNLIRKVMAQAALTPKVTLATTAMTGIFSRTAVITSDRPLMPYAPSPWNADWVT